MSSFGGGNTVGAGWFAALAAALVAAAGLGLAASARAAAQVAPDQYGSGGAPSGLMVEVTGELQRLDPQTYGYGEYLIVDELSGERYALEDGGQGILEPYVGQRVTVTGTEPAATEPPQDPRLLNVITVEPAAMPDPPEIPSEMGSITFVVNTEGDVPDGTEFFGLYGEPTNPDGEIPPFGQLGVVSLHDSDHDGTYTGVADVPAGESLALLASGNEAGPQHKIHPQSIVQRDATITVSGNETVSTTISFPEPQPTSGQDQYGAAGDGDATPPTEPASGETDRDGEPSEKSSSPGIAVLPDTGGSPLAPAGMLLAGAALTALGLVIGRRG